MGLIPSIMSTAMHSETNDMLYRIEHTIYNDTDQEYIGVCLGNFPAAVRETAIRYFERGSKSNEHIQEVKLCLHGLSIEEIHRLVTAINAFNGVKSFILALNSNSSDADLVKAVFAKLDESKYDNIRLNFETVSRRHRNIRALTGFFRHASTKSIELHFSPNNHDIHSSMASAILNVLSDSSELEQVGLSGSYCPFMLREAADLLYNNSSVRAVRLRSLTDEGWEDYEPAFRYLQRQLEQRNIVHNEMFGMDWYLDGDANMIAKVMECISTSNATVRLAIRADTITEPLVRSLSSLLQTNTSLRKIWLHVEDMDYNSEHTKGVLEMFGAHTYQLFEIKITEKDSRDTDLSTCPMKPFVEGMEALADGLLKSDCSTKGLSLRLYALQSKPCVDTFFSKLPLMKSLTFLSTIGIPLAYESLLVLERALEANTSLEDLRYTLDIDEDDELNEHQKSTVSAIKFFLMRNELRPLLRTHDTDQSVCDAVWPYLIARFDRWNSISERYKDVTVSLKYHMLRQRLDLLQNFSRRQRPRRSRKRKAPDA